MENLFGLSTRCAAPSQSSTGFSRIVVTVLTINKSVSAWNYRSGFGGFKFNSAIFLHLIHSPNLTEIRCNLEKPGAKG
ncbi:MAG: hypothetical protein CM15mP88_3160 [Pseudomonadota bacterium]|nr:MAG: hypothetical protein CM15mP88_3160 [Pseudomonadota bacterium]